MTLNRPIAWLETPSPVAVRLAVAELLPEMASRPLVVNDRVLTSNPRYFQGSAVLDEAYVVKFAWSEPAALRIAHESEVLKALGGTPLRPYIPAVVVSGTDPVLLISHLVPGEPFSWEAANSLSGTPRQELTRDLGRFLSLLHDAGTVDAVGPASFGPEMPEAQATTGLLRANFGRHVNRSRRALVEDWCDWVDSVLADTRITALLHGDLHGHNLLFDPLTGALRLVADFETAGLGDPAFDFRYLPGCAATTDVFLEVRRHYERLSAHQLDLDRVMAWHILTVLGDALWRGDAGVALPGGGGTASSWVDELDARLRSIWSM